jgi:predicted nucleic acid-binding protein
VAAFVIDASAGVEILTRTDRGKLLARQLEGDSELWIPELFYVEVLDVIRGQVSRGALDENIANLAIADLGRWKLNRVAHRSFIEEIWKLRHNFSAYDSVYVLLARDLGAQLLTIDLRLMRAAIRHLGIVVSQ